jgi:hypothetical protein
MAVSIKETTKRSGGESSRTTSERSGKRTFRVVYSADTPPATLVAVETAEDEENDTAIPTLRSGMPGDAARIAKKISVKPAGDGSGLVFDVEVSYERPSRGDEIENPLARPDEVSFDGSSEKTPFFLTEEEEPVPVVTSAGEPFEELQDRDTGIFKLVIEGNRASFHAGLYASYLYPATATNTGEVVIRGIIIGAGQGRLLAMSGSPQEENGVSFWRIRWEVAVAETWELEIEDRGFHENVDGKLKEIVKGTPPVKPDHGWPLDGNGSAMENAEDVPETLTFVRYPKKDFGAFNWTP